MRIKTLKPFIVRLIDKGIRFNEIDYKTQCGVVKDIQSRFAAMKGYPLSHYSPVDVPEEIVMDTWICALEDKSVEYIYKSVIAVISGQVDTGRYPATVSDITAAYKNIRHFNNITDIKTECRMLIESGALLIE